MTRITGTTGSINHQFTATTLMSVASFSSTPHEVMGGRSPRPRNDSAVSARIIEGMLSVAEAMRWLMKPGSRWRPMMRPGLAPIIWAAAAARPVEQGQDEGDAEIDQQRRPGDGQRRRQREPKRQMREALDDLGEALDDHVDPTAVVAGEPAQEQSERERERDT